MLDFLLQRFPAIPATTWGQRLAAGKVTSGEGRALDAAHPCRAGERYFYFREVEAEPRVHGEVETLAETAHFLIVDKPAGLPVHATGPFVRETLLARLERDLDLTGLSAAHRLDLETSGLVLVVKSRENRGLYQGLFARGEVSKEYLALAQVPAEPSLRRWRVENRLSRGEPFFRMHVVPGEVNAKTEIELLAWEHGVGRFRLRPETGKKHQLRVHMAGLGFPILGDRYYPFAAELVGARHASPAIAAEGDIVPARTRATHASPLPRGGHGGPPLRLLAWRLAFRDPVTGEAVEVESRRDLEGDLDGVSLATGAAFR